MLAFLFGRSIRNYGDRGRHWYGEHYEGLLLGHLDGMEYHAQGSDGVKHGWDPVMA